MLALVLGISTRRTEDLLTAVVAGLNGEGLEVGYLTAASMRDLTVHLMRSKSSLTIALVTEVDPEWAKVLSDPNCRPIYLHTDLSRAITETPDKLAHARAWLRGCASFLEAMDERCLIINGDVPGAEQGLADAVADRLGVTRRTLVRVESRGPPDVSDAESASARNVLESFVSLKEGHAPTKVEVGPQFFFNGTDVGTQVSGPIPVAPDVQSNLFYGPYLNLPRGVWQVRVRLRLSAALAGHSFFMDTVTAFGTKVPALSTYQIQIGGEREFSLEFVNEHPESPVEVRFYSAPGGKLGTIELDRVDFVRLSE